MFRPLYWPSSGCTPYCYKVTLQDTMCLLSNAHPSWAPYTLFQFHNTIAAKLRYFEHCYQEHPVSVPLELMLVHAI